MGTISQPPRINSSRKLIISVFWMGEGSTACSSWFASSRATAASALRWASTSRSSRSGDVWTGTDRRLGAAGWPPEPVSWANAGPVKPQEPAIQTASASRRLSVGGAVKRRRGQVSLIRNPLFCLRLSGLLYPKSTSFTLSRKANPPKRCRGLGGQLLKSPLSQGGSRAVGEFLEQLPVKLDRLIHFFEDLEAAGSFKRGFRLPGLVAVAVHHFEVAFDGLLVLLLTELDLADHELRPGGRFPVGKADGLFVELDCLV